MIKGRGRTRSKGGGNDGENVAKFIIVCVSSMLPRCAKNSDYDIAIFFFFFFRPHHL